MTERAKTNRKRSWEKPGVKSLSFQKTYGGPYASPVEGGYYAPQS